MCWRELLLRSILALQRWRWKNVFYPLIIADLVSSHLLLSVSVSLLFFLSALLGWLGAVSRPAPDNFPQMAHQKRFIERKYRQELKEMRRERERQEKESDEADDARKWRASLLFQWWSCGSLADTTDCLHLNIHETQVRRSCVVGHMILWTTEALVVVLKKFFNAMESFSSAPLCLTLSSPNVMKPDGTLFLELKGTQKYFWKTQHPCLFPEIVTPISLAKTHSL